MLTLQTKTVSLHSINSAVHTYTVFFLDTLSFFKFSIPCGKVTKNVKLLLLYFFKPLNFAVLPLVLPSMQTLFWLLPNPSHCLPCGYVDFKPCQEPGANNFHAFTS